MEWRVTRGPMAVIRTSVSNGSTDGSDSGRHIRSFKKQLLFLRAQVSQLQFKTPLKAAHITTTQTSSHNTTFTPPSASLHNQQAPHHLPQHHITP